ncbi:unnamed protein product [Rhizophagus irregularis]|nr:unnamed protein product [Rhizophagus irregularis]
MSVRKRVYFRNNFRTWYLAFSGHFLDNYLDKFSRQFLDNFWTLIFYRVIEGRNGQGNPDYHAIECQSTGRILDLIVVKREDFMKGFTQASVQMESLLTGRKRKANEIDDERDVDKVFGIVTDARDWYFTECTLDGEGKTIV